MEIVKRNDSGAAVEDVQQRLVRLGYLEPAAVDGVFGEQTERAVDAFRLAQGLSATGEVDAKAWSALVDASFCLGDRTLYLRMPYFHGHDVAELQRALGALGFACGNCDGIFGAHTESALRKFQLNLGLPTDGIAGAYTFAALRNLHHSWEGKQAMTRVSSLGFARAADVLEDHAVCLFGTEGFTRSVASRMSNLALATNPMSKMLSAETLLVKPDEGMLLMHIVLPGSATPDAVPRVGYADEESLAVRLRTAIDAARHSRPSRIVVELPGVVWESAGESRSAQHFAITLLDALCLALS